MKLRDKVVVVTGSTRGIGRPIKNTEREDYRAEYEAPKELMADSL